MKNLILCSSVVRIDVFACVCSMFTLTWYARTILHVSVLYRIRRVPNLNAAIAAVDTLRLPFIHHLMAAAKCHGICRTANVPRQMQANAKTQSKKAKKYQYFSSVVPPPVSLVSRFSRWQILRWIHACTHMWFYGKLIILVMIFHQCVTWLWLNRNGSISTKSVHRAINDINRTQQGIRWGSKLKWQRKQLRIQHAQNRSCSNQWNSKSNEMSLIDDVSLRLTVSCCTIVAFASHYRHLHRMRTFILAQFPFHKLDDEEFQ